MPDITLCKNNFCKVRFNCERYTAKPKEFHQSYDKFGDKKGAMCEQFINNEKYNLGA